MALRTLCRDGDFTAGRLVDGEVLFDSPQHLERRARVDRLLKYLNGDWRCDQIYHHCVPGVCDCGTEAEARERIFAALMENSATLGSVLSGAWAKSSGRVVFRYMILETPILYWFIPRPARPTTRSPWHSVRSHGPCPDLSRWGTVTRAAGMVALFSLCHSLLPTCIKGVFKKWDDAAPQPAMGGEDHDDDERHIIRKKAWRSRHVLTSEPIVSKLCAAAFVAIPLDALLAKLQHLDAQGNSLLDVADPGSSPILRAQRQVASGSLRGVSSGRFSFEADRGSP